MAPPLVPLAAQPYDVKDRGLQEAEQRMDRTRTSRQCSLRRHPGGDGDLLRDLGQEPPGAQIGVQKQVRGTEVSCLKK